MLSAGAAVNLPSQNAQQVRPLHSAVAHQHLEIARLLLDHGADVNAKQEGGFTPLLEAVQNGQVAMVKLLLSRGADHSAMNNDGQTAQSIAQEMKFDEIVTLLKDLS